MTRKSVKEQIINFLYTITTVPSLWKFYLSLYGDILVGSLYFTLYDSVTVLTDDDISDREENIPKNN